MPPIAFLGTGLLGSAFVEAALARGERVAVWNRTTERTRALAEAGARVAHSPAEAVAGVARAHLVLSDDDVVDAVIAAMRPGLAPDTVIVDHTTTLPARTAARALRLEAEGIRYLHCPVFIGPAAARRAQGTILASGRREFFDLVEPALRQQAARVEFLSERPDHAAILKLCGNALILGTTALVSDALSVARGAGLSPEEALKVTGIVSTENVISGRGRKLAAGDFTPSFELVMARKDLRLMIESAGDLPLMTLPGIAARMDGLIAEGLGALDYGVIGRDVRPADGDR